MTLGRTHPVVRWYQRASSRATWYGHRMRWEFYADPLALGTCVRCTSTVECTRTAMTGSAVTRTCPRRIG